MKVKKIVVEFEPEDDFQKESALVYTFNEGRWTADGPMISSWMAVCHEIWKTIRSTMRTAQ